MIKFRTSSESNVWFTSDTHYGHTNICLGTSSWEDKSGCRNFDTIEKMNSAIVNGINKCVKEKDILIHLGDWSMGGYDNIKKFRNRLSCQQHICLVTGNHDENILKYRGETEEMFYINPNYVEFLVDGQLIVACHYPIVSWNRAHQGSWMLHGHSHGTLFNEERTDNWYNKSKIWDVGIDHAYTLFGEYRPFSFSELRQILSSRIINSTDHHNEDTT